MSLFFNDGLPNGYTRLSYITWSGNGYYDTGIKVNSSTAIYMEYTANASGKWLFGSRTSGGNTDTFGVYLNNGSQYWAQVGGNSSSTGGYFNLDVLSRHGIYVSGTTFKQDNTTAGSYSNTLTNGTYNLVIGTINSAGTMDNRYFSGNLYAFKVWEGTTLVRDFVPALRTSDSRAGLFDKVSGVYYPGSWGASPYYGALEIERIIYINGGTSTELNALKHGSTTTWGKKYTIHRSYDDHCYLSINRTSSVMKSAGTVSGSGDYPIYYGDVLTISATANSGYNLSSFTVNGSPWTSGNSITVTGDVSVVATSVAATQWRTVWTGSQAVGSAPAKPTMASSTYTLNPTTLSADIDMSRPTRIYGTWRCSNINWLTPAQTSGSFNNEPVELSTSDKTLWSETVSNGATLYGLSGVAKISGTNIVFVIQKSSNTLPISFAASGNTTLTKIEQYY